MITLKNWDASLVLIKCLSTRFWALKVFSTASHVHLITHTFTYSPYLRTYLTFTHWWMHQVQHLCARIRHTDPRRRGSIPDLPIGRQPTACTLSALRQHSEHLPCTKNWGGTADKYHPLQSVNVIFLAGCLTSAFIATHTGYSADIQPISADTILGRWTDALLLKAHSCS